MHHYYMPLHECVHNNVAGCPKAGSTPRLHTFVQDVVGHVSSLAIGIGFSAHGKDHMEHHKFTNHDHKDPDAIGLSGPVSTRILVHVVIMVASLILAVLPIPGAADHIAREDKGPHVNQDGSLTKVGQISKENIEALIFFRRLQLAVALVTGCWREVIMFWWLPQQFAIFTISMVFAWLPHHPHADVGRYKDTRVTLIGSWEPLRSILSYTVFCGHDYHLVHHLYPRVPWTRLKRLFRELEPVLRERGARIEGGAGQPKVLLTAPRGKLPPVCGPFSPGWEARKHGKKPLLSEETGGVGVDRQQPTFFN
mmetsp:Transcript_22313/g.69122  ORF Transcript_22313/g.69122 Transcript_22313/m.69122 type:complete len:309 (+) Transcript_22313:3-929(+)